MAIWTYKNSIEELNKRAMNTMVSTVGICFTEIGDDYLRATMPVNDKTVQPYALLHGGASATLAETLGSTAGQMCVASSNNRCVGLELNANHIRSATSGFVTGTTRPVHIGKSTQVWNIEITDENDRLICLSRLTLAVLTT